MSRIRITPTEPLSPLGPVRLAVTVDDLFLWKHTPVPDGYTPHVVGRELAKAFARHRLPGGVYSFSNTLPAAEDPDLYRVFDQWCEAGHHVANHTHRHASLNWIEARKYIDDIERTEELIARWSTRAPTRYFRYCMDMWGDTREKHEAVESYLQRHGYTSTPLSTWFYDHAWIVPHWRAAKLGDREGLAFLRKTYVEAALDQLRRHAALARQLFGRDVAHVWLVHGTPMAADRMEAILDAFSAAGVEFVSLEEAMSDPIYQQGPPVITPRFRNLLQKHAEARGVAMPEVPPLKLLAQVEAVAPIEGASTEAIFGRVLRELCELVDGEFSWHGWD